jgi:hypothetical protein
MLGTSQSERDKRIPNNADSGEVAEAKRELLYSSIACLVIFCLFLGCTFRGIVPVVYTIILGIVLGSAILVRLISIYSLHSESLRRDAQTETGTLSGEPPIVVWIRFVPIPITRRGYPLFLVILIVITVIAGVVTTWIRHHIL